MLILCSKSPRRFQLLTQQGFQFETASVEVDETPDERLSLPEQVIDIASRKAQAVASQRKESGSIFLAADTAVILRDQFLGKPADAEEARSVLSQLSGTQHSVLTGCYLLQGDQAIKFYDETHVFFRSLSAEEIDDYVRSGEPMDKAGSYGIQGLGGKFVERYEGSFSNVVGLPMEKLCESLKALEFEK